MITQFKYHSISRNLTLGLFIAFGLVTSLTLYASLRFSSHQAAIELETKAEEYITSLVDILAVPLWHFNEQVIEAIGKSYAQNDLIAGLRINGEVGNWDFTVEKPDQKIMVSRTGTITYQGDYLGTVTISMSSRYYSLFNRRFFWSYAVTLLLMIVILSLLSGGLLRQLLKKPFMQFVDLVNAYASGDQEAFSQHITYIELQPLIAVLKQMGEKISARTDELQQEITERKRKERELQDSLAEIQRLQEQLQTENIYLREEIRLEHNFDEIIGQSEELRYVLSKVEQVAPTDTTVLIFGETGTGKELVARALHHASPRKDYPLVKVNCAALPAHLIESELFGHEKGAFTGAHTKQLGRFELAHRGTIFLDEIGELPLELQPKLLRVLQDGEFERLGSSQTIKVDVRVIAATNRNLKEEVRVGRFRRDVFYRLSVYPLSVPPLREHPNDIPLLVQVFVQKFSKKLGKQIETIPQKTMNALQQYPWPGNIRELENVIERAVITTQNNTLCADLPKTPELRFEIYKTLEEVEREHILRILEHTNWKINGDDGAAFILDLHPNTLRSRMQKLGIKGKRKYAQRELTV
jgi:transcriptional regulator with PAS, ATPase and Fis domain